MSIYRCNTVTAVFFGVLFSVSACTSNTIQDTYYSLAPGTAAGSVIPALKQRESRLTLVSITLPKFLQNQNLVMQNGAHTLVPARHHFWAEPLEDGIAKVLVQGITKNASTLQVESNAGRWSAGTNCSLRLEFDSFHATQSGQVISSGRFWLQDTESKSPIVQQFNYSDDLLLDGYAQTVSQLQSSLQVLASAIVSAIEDSGVCKTG